MKLIHKLLLFVFATAFSITLVNAQLLNNNTLLSKSKTITPEDLWGKNGDQSLVASFDPSNTYLNYIATTPGGPTEAPTDYSLADGDIVTYSMMGGLAGLHMESSIARSPVLGSDAVQNSFVEFASASTRWYEIPNSTKVFNYMHKASPTFAIYGAIKRKANGTAERIMGSNNSTTANVGILVQINSSNQFNAIWTYGSAGNNIFSKTSTATITVADGWVWWGLTVNGSGTGTGTLYILKQGGSLITETFNVNASGTSSDATNNLRIGNFATNGTYLNSYLSSLYFRNTPGSQDDFMFFTNFNRVRGKYRFTVDYSEFDSDVNVFTGDLTTAATTDGDLIQSWKSATPYPGSDPFRYINNPTSVNRPTYIASDSRINNHPAIDSYGLDYSGYPGINSELITNNVAFGSAKVPIFTKVLVFKNDKSDPGGHPISGLNAAYVAITGSSYSLGEYGIYHYLTSGNSSPPASPLAQPGNNYNIIIFTVNVPERTTSAFFNGQKVTQISDVLPVAEIQRMFYTWKPEGEHWWFDGSAAYQKNINGIPTDEDIFLRIYTPLTIKYGVD